MVVKIRLARFGKTNRPFYNIVVAHARTARNSRPLEVIGTYDPVPKPDLYGDEKKLHKDIKLDITRAQYWVGVGAQPTDTMWRLLSMVGILQPKWPKPLPGQQQLVKKEPVKKQAAKKHPAKKQQPGKKGSAKPYLGKKPAILRAVGIKRAAKKPQGKKPVAKKQPVKK
ncbi:ribosomal protein S16 domain-containing protein [Podospora fimiseda]|uniref:Ribosomal protein S16 domain-containing protein n=1 Tax=Podospora fimiseda TaxID=252190 RepID=A0AAN7BQS4_9PEZI|nr:ribosomal protein S16 domain-containing protein [Podospora fimiseda]